MFIDKIYEIIFMTIIIVLLPVMILSLKADQTIQTYVNDAVEEFVNRSCATGIISSSEYEEMVNRLDATGIVYDIYIVHSKEQVSPKTDDNGNVEGGNVINYYEEYRNADIYEYLFPDNGEYKNNKYYLNEGDYLKVIVENKKPTPGTRIFSMFNTSNAERSIFVSKGGYVGNETTQRR